MVVMIEAVGMAFERVDYVVDLCHCTCEREPDLAMTTYTSKSRAMSI